MERLKHLISAFFDSKMLNPHGICLLWRPELLFTHAVSDVLIGLSYFSIPLVLTAFLNKRPDVRFSWAVWMFVAFILLCGLTHFMMVWTLWHPDYGIEALFKAATAIVSVTTALALWPLLPKAIALPSTSDLEARVEERDAALRAKEEVMATMVELREHDRRQSLLLNELNHRVKNTLSVVQSLATQTLKAAPDLQIGRELLVERLLALSAVHNLLVERVWDTVRLQEVITRMLVGCDRPYVLTGDDLVLTPNLSITLSMVLHELAANAARHGAWSAKGHVRIAICLEDETFRLQWSEHGGPPPAAALQQGFGLKLLLKSAPRELCGDAAVDFTVDGLCYVLSAPRPASSAPLAA